MQTWVRHMGQKGSPDYGKRAYREAFLYQMITFFDNSDRRADREASLDKDAIDARFLTLEQKRRLRGEIVRSGLDKIREHNAVAGRQEWSQYDLEPYIEAFFETNYGKEYASHKRRFVNPDPSDVMFSRWKEEIARWTMSGGTQPGDPETTLVSPFDPIYNSADLFTEDHYEIGYVIADGAVNDSTQIASVRMRGTGNMALYNAQNIQSMQRSTAYDLASDLTKSGYHAVEHYIRTKKDKQEVKDFLLSELNKYSNNGNGGAVSAEETKFMGDVCRYLSSSGIKFGVALGSDGNLVAKTESPRAEIRILSRGDENYQGRIYNRGKITYLSPMKGQANSDAANALRSAITPEDRLNMIKWYFGESVPFSDDRRNPAIAPANSPASANAYASAANHQVGMMYDSIKLEGSEMQSVRMAGSRSDMNSVAFAVKKMPGTDVDGKLNENYSLINIMHSCSSVKHQSDFQDGDFASSISVSDYQFTSRDGRSINSEEHYEFPIEKVLPGDRKEEILEDGTVYVSRDIKLDTDRSYYKSLVAREKLADWVERAKLRHREMMDLEGMIAFQQSMADADSKYPFSEDDNVAAEQKRCWNILTGHSDASGKTMEERIAAMEAHYADYLEEAFGSVPEIRRPGLPDYPESGGFDPIMVARYIDSSDSYGIQKNQSYIRHMLYQLGSDYDSSWLKGDDYFTRAMKNALVRFDEGKVAGQFSLSRYRQDPAAVGMDDKPFTKSMMVHTCEVMEKSGCFPNTIAIRVDDKGVMEYSAYASTKKDGKGRSFQKLFDTIKTNRRKINAERKRNGVAEMLPELSERSFDDIPKLVEYFSDAEIVGTENPAEIAKHAAEIKSFKNDLKNIRRIHGYIGQIFEPNEHGAIIQNTAVPDNRVLIPGYDAYLIENDPEDPKPMRKRLRLVGLEQQMRNAITMNIHDAIYTLSSEYSFDPHEADLNAVYRKTYDTVLDRPYYDRMMLKVDPRVTMTDEQKAILNRQESDFDPLRGDSAEVRARKVSEKEWWLANKPAADRYDALSEYEKEEGRCFLRTIDTMKGRCRFPNEYGEKSTTMAQSYLEHPHEDEAIAFDYYISDLCDNRNLRVLGPDFDGIFDSDMTGTAKNQGIVRYLNKDILDPSRPGGINPDGSVVSSTDMNAKCALMDDPALQTMAHNSWDRRQMVTTQILTALGTPRHVGVAMLNIEGYNFDDAMPVTKRFAEANPILDPDGNPRPLMPQDKLSDFSGNKGVISAVVDPYLYSGNLRNNIRVDWDTLSEEGVDCYFMREDGTEDPEPYPIGFTGNTVDLGNRELVDSMVSRGVEGVIEAIQKENGVYGQDDLLKFFAENPNVDIAMAPYSGMSRSNGSIARDLLSDHGDCVVNGQVVKGGMGYTNIIIVDMPADVKTHWYGNDPNVEEDDVEDDAMNGGDDKGHKGEGRYASGQLAWALQAKGCTNIMREFYGSNQGAFDTIREYAIAIGLDFNENMEPVIGYHAQVSRGEKRPLMKLPAYNEANDLCYKDGEFVGYLDNAKLNKADKGDRSVMLNDKIFKEERSRFMDRINASGGFMELPFQLDFNTASYMKGSSKSVMDNITKGAFLIPATGQTYTVGGKEKPTYGIPILPANMRSGQEFQDGTSMPHDFTLSYLSIYKNAMLYTACEQALASGGIDSHQQKLLKDKMESAQKAAQKKFDEVTRKIVEMQFDTKNNVIRKNLMKSRIPNSATAVWSPDPRLDLDQVGMSLEHAGKLGLVDKNGKLKKDASVLVWRDPILHDDNVRYMRVAIDDHVMGVTINPLVDKSFDGDFDGDSVAIVPLQDPKSNTEAYTKFSLANNLLQKGVVNKDGTHPLYIQTGLDIATNMYLNPSLKSRLDDLHKKINELEVKAAAYFDNPGPETEAAISVKTSVKVDTEDGRKIYEQRVITGKNAIGTLRRQYARELNALAKESLKGTGGAHIVAENEKAFVESVQKIVDSGAKGNQSKMRDYMDNVGIDYKLGDDGRVDVSSVSLIRDASGAICSRATQEGRQRQVDNAIQETAAYKADNTSQGGTNSQNGVAAMRDYCLQEVLELTYPITQAILQSKHDPKDAKIKDEIVRFWGRDVWNGYKLTGDFTSGNPESIQSSPHRREKYVVRDAKGKPVQRQELLPEYSDNGQMRLDDSGRPVMKYQPMFKRDGQGRYVLDENKQKIPVYETAYKKCTPQEWVDQVMGMMCALKVDVNRQFVEVLANKMERMEPSPVKSAATGYTVKSNKTVVMGNKGTVAGFADFEAEHGSLMDRMAYTGRVTALVMEAVKKDPNYRDYLEQNGRSHELKNDGFKSLAADSQHKVDVTRDMEARLAKAREEGDQNAADFAVESLKAIQRNMTPSGSFTPRSFVDQAKGDAYRVETGSEKNVSIRKKGGVEVAIESDPRPVGCRGSLLRRVDYDAGAAFMGEAQALYEKRLANAGKETPEESGRIQEKPFKMDMVVQSHVVSESPFTDAKNHPVNTKSNTPFGDARSKPSGRFSTEQTDAYLGVKNLRTDDNGDRSGNRSIRD